MREIGVPLVETVPEYIVRDGLVHVIIEGTCLACFPLRIFERGIAKSQKAIAAYKAKRAEVVPIRRGHAARS